MNQISTIATSILPAPMSIDLDRRVSISLNAIEPRGMGYTISADRALSAEDQADLKRRADRLNACLAPAGEQAAMVALGEMRLMMLDGGKSEAEADKALELWVKNLADLPRFAIEAATTDFLRGDAGERGFVPKLPVFRQHVMAKLQPHAEDKARVTKVLKAHENIQARRENPERRAQVAKLALDSIQSMRLAGLKVETERAGKEFTAPSTPLSAQAELDRLMDDVGKPIAPLSPEMRSKFARPEDDVDDQEAQA